MERFVNVALPFPYQGKLLFINLVISVEEFLEDIKKIVEHTSLNAEIRDDKNEKIALFSSTSKEWTTLEKSTFKSLNRVPYKIYLYRSGMTFFEWGYVLCLSVFFLLSSIFLYRCLQKNALSLKTNLEGETLAKLKYHHEAFKEAVHDAENERNKLVTAYFQIVSDLIQKTKTDIINFERSQRSPALSYRVVENLWNLLKEIEKGDVLFSYPSTSFTVLDTLQGCLSFHKTFLHQNNIQTNIEECVEDKKLIGNEFLVKILFIRLLDYCLQDVPQGGVLTIKLKPAKDHSIALSMKSNGFGLNDKDLSCVTFHQQEQKGDPFLCHFYSLETLANCLGAEMSSSATLHQGREVQILLPRQLDLKNPSQSSYPKGVKGEVISLFEKQ